MRARMGFRTYRVLYSTEQAFGPKAKKCMHDMYLCFLRVQMYISYDMQEVLVNVLRCIVSGAKNHDYFRKRIRCPGAVAHTVRYNNL